MSSPKPSLGLSIAVLAALVLVWTSLRLYFFGSSVFPLTFVLPLLVCLWTRRIWQIWTLAAIFVVIAAIKTFWILPSELLPGYEGWVYLGVTWTNVLVGAGMVHAVLLLLERIERRSAIISAQNSELEAQAEELSQQNEEIKAQSEELAQQNEEIESQTEEMASQNEELVDTNQRLANREGILQLLLEASRMRETIPDLLGRLCERAVEIIGHPSVAVFVLEKENDSMVLRGRGGHGKDDEFPLRWAFEGSLSQVVLGAEKTAYIADLSMPGTPSNPFAWHGNFGSALASPFAVPNSSKGVVVACSAVPSHWTDEQFRIIEWIAAQCGLILEVLRHQDSLARKAKEIASASQAKDRFLAMLSHELRTPLTPVLAAVSALENDGSLTEQVRTDLKMIRRNVGIQSKLIDDLLDLTRISQGKLKVDRRPLRIADLLQNTIEIVAPDLDARGQTAQLHLDGVGNAIVLGDGPRIQQVFWNLFKNAVKFSPKDSKIIVEAAQNDGSVIVRVRDNGEGIEHADLERIFLPFEQALEKKPRKDAAGLGLGLAIAKATVEMHDGSISVESQGRGMGSTFSVILPVHAQDIEESDSEREPSMPGEGEGGALHILLVEDHRDTGVILARLLQGASHSVDHAENAAEAFRLFQMNRYDVVVSDVGLPDESGVQLMRRMRAIRPGVGSVCLSGFGMEEDERLCREAGFQEHLTKPVEFSQLLSAVLRAAGRPQWAKAAQ